jgi:hypothetical protein
MSRAKSSDPEEFREILEMFHRARSGETADPFTSALEDLEGDNARTFENQLRDALDQIPELQAHRSYIPAEILTRIYADAGSPRIQQPNTPKTEHDTVADELQLISDLSVDDLNRIRREYALANHPDLVAPAKRDQATRRMTIANMLIDQAIRQKQSGAAHQS